MCTDDQARYLQFQPVAYAIKLHIEMNMADLIRKVARAPNNRAHAAASGMGPRIGGFRSFKNNTGPNSSRLSFEDHFMTSLSQNTNTSRGYQTTHIEHGSTKSLDIDTLNQQDAGGGAPIGILKTTVVMQTVHRNLEEHKIGDFPSQCSDEENALVPPSTRVERSNT